MIQKTITLLFIVFTNIVFGQTLFTIYKKLPNHSAMAKFENRQKMISAYKNGNNKIDSKKGLDYIFKIVDRKNGYLTIEGAFEGSWSMCYWNLDNGTKLVAVLMVGCGPMCSSRLEFFKYNGTSLEPYIQPAIENIDESSFFSINKKNLYQLESKYDLPSELLFKLPRKGKNITAKIYYSEDSNYEKFLKPKQLGNLIVFSFQKNGIFKKESIVWNYN